ncbi:unnamed protein product [Euphydryas editha]|uniref:Peptidase aspartic putative domain-containing protein n=1 Tax=Euphydryas editha TaxID=104508 RepID=A0AAU9VBA5_EUPED|nr:unnamed protein product [Euphydryas editha]
MAELKALIAGRGYAKASITKLKKNMDADVYNDAAPEKIRATLARLESVFSEYNEYCIKILAVDINDSEDSSLIEDTYLDLVTKLNTLLKKSALQTATPCTSKIKLPNIIIPTFTGKYTEYYEFINIFNAMIHNDISLTPVQKLYYLKGFLSGEPHALINNLPLQDVSYTEAMKLLQERYDNKTKIVHEHVYTLLDLPTITKSTTSTLRDMISEVKQHLAALKNLDEPVDSWDSIIVCILSRKLDSFSSRAFQMDRDNKSRPTVKEFLSYLEKRALALDNLSTGSSFTQQKQQPHRLASHAVAANPASATCIYCKCAHKLFQCPSFKMAAPSKRMEFAIANKLCKTCLSPHKYKCKFLFRCAECKQGHNTLLHQNNFDDSKQASLTPSVTLLSNASQGHVLLPTARIKFISQSGTIIYIRALLDSGSQASFVTQKVVDLLGINTNTSNTTIICITNAEQTVDRSIHLDVHSTVYPFKVNVNCHVVKNITTKLPQEPIDISKLAFPVKCKLADESFSVPGDVHLLLGADVFFQVLLPQPEGKPSPTGQGPATEDTLYSNVPSIVHTSFGYIVAGRSSSAVIKNKKTNKVVSLFCYECNDSLSDSLNSFWTTEQVPEIFPEKFPEHEYCEKLFNETTKLENNKFQVSLPIKVPLQQVNSELGESFHLAYVRFINLEKRLRTDSALFQQYKNFIDQYIELNHGEYFDINSYDMSKDPVYFLPHHAVIKRNAVESPPNLELSLMDQCKLVKKIL